jgi:MerR family transcriptional regulator, light-induced transcriptional regulator
MITMDAGLTVLGAEGLARFQLLAADAVNSVTGSLYPTREASDLQSEQRARDACREDLVFHLEFLRPVLEFGLLQPMVDYLCWLRSLLAARGIPAEHLALSLDLFGRYFAKHMRTEDGAVVCTALRAARIESLQAKEAPVAPIRRSDPWPESASFEAALLAGHQREALAVVDRCIDSGRGLVDVELHVIQPSLYDIGKAWQANRVTVAKEHMATAIALSVMTVGLLRSPAPATIGKRVLLACVEGNDHAVGLRMVADAFQLAGWDVQYLGANMPGAAIIRQAADWRADLVGLSVSFAQQLRIVKQVIAQLRGRVGDARPAVIIGGLAVNRFSQLADMVGADACGADAQAAVAYANQIAGCWSVR